MRSLNVMTGLNVLYRWQKAQVNEKARQAFKDQVEELSTALQRTLAGATLVLNGYSGQLSTTDALANAIACSDGLQRGQDKLKQYVSSLHAAHTQALSMF